MSKDLNKWMGIGRLGRDPEVKYTASGKAVANIVLACGDDYKNKQTGQKVEQTEWIRVVAFDRLAEIIGKYTLKGSKIYIEGKFTTRKWQNQQGQDQYTTEIVASEMQMLDSRQDAAPQQQSSRSAPQRARQQAPQQATQQAPQQATQQAPPPVDAFDDTDIPF